MLLKLHRLECKDLLSGFYAHVHVMSADNLFRFLMPKEGYCCILFVLTLGKKQSCEVSLLH